jgi:hypothetical protein
MRNGRFWPSLPVAKQLSVVVIFALVANGENGDEVTALDLEQSDVARCTERNDELTQEWIVSADRFAVTEGGALEARDGVSYGFQGPFGQLPVRRVTVEDEPVKSDEIVFGLAREADAKSHFLAADRFAFCSMPSRRANTLGAAT